MTAYQLFLSLLGIYIFCLILTGLYFNRKQQSDTDFWLAGKSAGWMSIGFSIVGPWLAAGAILAVIGFYILLGTASVWGFVAPNILALLIVAFFAQKIKSLPAIPQPELLELQYGNHLRLPVVIVITVVMILFAVADFQFSVYHRIPVTKQTDQASLDLF